MVSLPGMVGFYKSLPSTATADERGEEVSSTSEGEEDEEGDCSDEEGWITPDNYQEACGEMGGVEEEVATGVGVGCVTTDFAMQVRNDLATAATK